MPGMSIGQVARSCGLAPSAIRYYERAGLLPKPIRVSSQRSYGSDIIGRLRLVQVAREAGFSIAETRTFVAGFSAATPPAIRWRTLARRKMREIEAQLAQLRRMKRLLESGFHCRCLSIEDCARLIGEASPERLTARSRASARDPDSRAAAVPGAAQDADREKRAPARAAIRCSDRSR